MKKYLSISLLFVLMLAACSKEEPTPQQQIDGDVSEYINQILDLMESRSINKYKIDWPDFRNKVLNEIGPAQTIEETFVGIRLALTMLNDNHSFFIPSDGQPFGGDSRLDCNFSPAESMGIVPENIGYIKITSFSGSEGGELFATEIQNKIKEQDNDGTIGWIVDLRGNTGGNMWPMLAGVGPLLGNNTVGHFIDPDDIAYPYGYSFGASVSGNSNIVQLTEYHLMKDQDARVAVLLDNAIASSGEAIAIAFIGRPNTRSFGTATCGLSTANSSIPLSDGSSLILTTSYMADRNKNKFGVPIEPDVEVDSGNLLKEIMKFFEE